MFMNLLIRQDIRIESHYYVEIMNRDKSQKYTDFMMNALANMETLMHGNIAVESLTC